jgi:DNA-binding PadR family transcriptional regulator
MNADTHELLLLGLLDQQSMHGYRLTEFLEHRLETVSNLTRPTAYRLLEKLYRQGLVERVAERDGHRPERMVYQISPNGRARLEVLLREQLAATPRVYYGGNVALLFADRLPIAERNGLLARRRESVAEQRERVAAYASAHHLGSSPRLVLEHDLAHLDAELDWLDRLIGSPNQAGLDPFGSS